jgi:hypothetical protein
VSSFFSFDSRLHSSSLTAGRTLSAALSPP